MSMNSTVAYEANAAEFLKVRDQSMVGAAIVEQWAQSLPSGTEVLEIACGGGLPITRVLLDAGLRLWAIDSSPTLLAAFKTRFPSVPTQCAIAQESDYFERQYGAAISIGLIFLLNETDQAALLRRVSEILLPGGRFLFTAPIERGTWRDVNTGHECISLGRAQYEATLEASGLRLTATYEDEGKNNYYSVETVV